MNSYGSLLRISKSAFDKVLDSWAISGYGLRALRSIGSLAAVFVIGGWLLHAYGTTRPMDFVDGVIFSVQTSVPSSGTSVTLTRWRKLLDVALSITGPVLFGLAVLGLRSKVRR